LKKLLVERRYLLTFIEQPDNVQISKHISLKDDLVHIENQLIDLGLEIIILAKLIQGTLDAGTLECFHLNRLDIFQIK